MENRNNFAEIFRPGQLAKTTAPVRVEVPGLTYEYYHKKAPSYVPPRYEDVWKAVPTGAVILLLGYGLEEDTVEETWTSKRYGRFYVDFLWEEKTVRWFGYNFKAPTTFQRPAAERQFATNFNNFFTILS